MEGDTQASSGEVEVQLPAKVDVKVEGDGEVLVNGNPSLPNKAEKKEGYEEETISDGDFIKIDRELIDVKEGSRSVNTTGVEEISSLKDSNSSNLTAKREADEKIKALEHQLETVSQQLQISESEKLQLRSDIAMTSEKLEKLEKHCELLEADSQRMKNELLEAEQRQNRLLERLQEASGALEVKNKELDDVNGVFGGLSAELERSRKRMQELETQLVSSTDEARKFEELSRETSSHAEVETKKALELEKMLEVAKLNAKELEGQMGNLQVELKGLYDKVSEHQKVEEALSTTASEMSAVQEKLDLSKSLIADLEQKLASGEVVIHELTEELNLRKASEEQMREDLQSLENLLSASKEDIQGKLAKLEELELKLQEEVNNRETVEGSLRNHEVHAVGVQEELVRLTGEKDVHERAVSELKENLSLTKELCSELEDKLNTADQNLGKTGTLLSQALACNEELEQKLKSLEDLLEESKLAAEDAARKNLELDALIQASNATEQEVKGQLRETETRLISAEKRNSELEQQIAVTELKLTDANREIEELKGKTAELTTLIRAAEEEGELSKRHVLAFEDKIGQLESSFSMSSSRNKELEQELKDLAEKCAEHEGRANATHQRSLELEDLFHASHSKAEDAGQKANDLELLLDAANFRTQELEKLLDVMETKHKDAEAESKQHCGRVSEISAELEAFQAKSASLEFLLQTASEKEKELADALDRITAEKNKFEELSKSSLEKLAHSENLLEVLQNELKSAQGKLERTEKDLEASTIREGDILERLRSAEEQLEHQQRAAELAAAGRLELETLHQSLVKESEIKLQEASLKFSEKDSEARQLHENLKSVNEQVSFYQSQAIETAEKVASLNAELESYAVKFVALGNTIEDLKKNLAETEVKAEQSSSENELLAGTNSKLRDELESHQHKVNELHDLLSAIHAEKEATAEQLASHVKTLAELTDERSRGLEIQTTTESRLNEAETQLHEAIQKFSQRDLEARDLNEKLLALEDQVRAYEEQARQAAAAMESQKVELEETRMKLQNLEGNFDEIRNKTTKYETENEDLVQRNLSISEELAAYEAKVNELKMTLNEFNAEKEHTSVQLDSSRKTIEDLMQQISSEGGKFESQISSLMVENGSLNEMYQAAKKELQEVISQMEEKLNDHRARETSLTADMEILKQELTEKSLLQAHISELEHQLLAVESKSKEEIETIQSVAREIEAGFSSKLEEHTRVLHEKDALDEKLRDLQKELDLAQSTISAKDKEAVEKLALVSAEVEDLKHKLSQSTELENKVIELETKLRLAATTSGEQVKDKIPETDTKDGVEVKSRDLGLGISTPAKRKSKKKSEGTPSETSAAHPSGTFTADHSGAMAFKFVLGVVLVSVIIGFIIGKRY